MSEYIDRLYEEYRRAAKIGKDLMDLAASENRELTPEEAEQRDRAFDDVTRLKADIDKTLNFQKLAAAGDEFRSTAAPVIETARVERRDPTDMEMFRSLWSTNLDKGEIEFRPSGMVQRTGNTVEAIRALQSAGGSAIETSFADFVVVYERTVSPMLDPRAVSIINRADGSPFTIPRITADPAPAGTLTAEAGGITELDLTASAITLNPYKYALTNLWSQELAQDNTIGLEDLIARTTGRALGLNIGSALTLADGSDKPQGFAADGLVSGTTTASGTANNTFFGHTDIITVFYALAVPYRAVGSWQMSTLGLAKVRKLKDSTEQLIWQPALQAGEPETVLGRPVFENPHLGTVGSATRPIYFGDFSRYYVAKTGTRVESSSHYKFATDQLALKTVERVDGDLADVVAIQALKCGNT